MGLHSQIVTQKEVVYGTVPAVSYYGVNVFVGIALMGFDHLFQHLTIINRSRGNGSGRDHLVVGIYHPMCLVAQF